MKALFWFGLVVLVLGVASFFIAVYDGFVIQTLL